MQHYPHKKEQSIFQVKIKRTLDIVQEEIWPNILWKVLTYRVWHKFFTFNNKKFSILNQSRWYSGNWIIRFYPKKMCLIPKYATLHCLSILFLLHMIWCLISENDTKSSEGFFGFCSKNFFLSSVQKISGQID